MISFLAAFISSVCAALGLGGGTVLLLYLTLFTEISQIQAQGINLLVFLPVALLSLWFHHRNGYVQWKSAARCVLTGIPGAIIGCILSGWLEVRILRLLFGLFLLVMGVRELFSKAKK